MPAMSVSANSMRRRCLNSYGIYFCAGNGAMARKLGARSRGSKSSRHRCPGDLDESFGHSCDGVLALGGSSATHTQCVCFGGIAQQILPFGDECLGICRLEESSGAGGLDDLGECGAM